MQQKTFEGNKSSWQDSLRNSNIYKPFRCPQCGENARFRSLSSLRAHLDYMHSYEERYFWGKSGIFCSLKDSDLKNAIEPLNQTQTSPTDNDFKQKTTSATFRDLANESRKIHIPMEIISERPTPLIKSPFSEDSTNMPNSVSVFPSTRTKLQTEPQGKAMLDQIAESVDKTIEKKIDKLNKELCQKTSELLEVRAAFLQLSQKKQEVQRRERALSRQVDVAVELIAVLRQRLTESEQELQRKEEEVVTINHFLEAAAEKEFRGKRRLQQFIENLLQRVELAEKQLEYYQSRQIKNSQAGVGDVMKSKQLPPSKCHS
ncbi:protein ZNF365 isoform 2-T2 [Rhinophrynus dorsalis]